RCSRQPKFAFNKDERAGDDACVVSEQQTAQRCEYCCDVNEHRAAQACTAQYGNLFVSHSCRSYSILRAARRRETVANCLCQRSNSSYGRALQRDAKMNFLALNILNLGVSLSMVCAVIGLAFAFFLIAAVKRAPSGNERMRQISGAVQEGAKAYLNR